MSFEGNESNSKVVFCFFETSIKDICFWLWQNYLFFKEIMQGSFRTTVKSKGILYFFCPSFSYETGYVALWFGGITPWRFNYISRSTTSLWASVFAWKLFLRWHVVVNSQVRWWIVDVLVIIPQLSFLQ